MSHITQRPFSGPHTSNTINLTDSIITFWFQENEDAGRRSKTPSLYARAMEEAEQVYAEAVFHRSRLGPSLNLQSI